VGGGGGGGGVFGVGWFFVVGFGGGVGGAVVERGPSEPKTNLGERGYFKGKI